MAKTYEIRTLSDFFKVPNDRIEDCLKEFAVGLEFLKANHELMGLENGQMEFFNWTDDGKKNITADFKFGKDVIRSEVKEEG